MIRKTERNYVKKN